MRTSQAGKLQRSPELLQSTHTDMMAVVPEQKKVYFSLSVYLHWRSMVTKQFIAPIQGSAAAADPLKGQVPLVVDMTLRWEDMTIRDEILEGLHWDTWKFSVPGIIKKDSPEKILSNDTPLPTLTPHPSFNNTYPLTPQSRKRPGAGKDI